MAYPKILAFVLAGGKGKSLSPLTDFRSKPAVHFGGRYRIVDFVLGRPWTTGVRTIGGRQKILRRVIPDSVFI